MPLSGWLGSAAHGFDVTWFGLVGLPTFAIRNLSLSRIMFKIHFWLAISLGLVLLVHISAAIRHHFVLKDDVLRRMLSLRLVCKSDGHDNLEF